MKRKFKYSWVVALMALGLSTSCTNDFEPINTDPNKMNVGDITPYNLFEPLIYNSTYSSVTGSAGSTMSYWTYFYNNDLCQFTAFTGGTTNNIHRYYISDSNWSSVWNMFARYGANAQHMYELSVTRKEEATKAIALTWKVYMMSNLTDLFGDIAYKEAFTGRFEDGTITPKFESQKEVYEDMFAELETANDIYATDPTFDSPKIDMVYGGDMKLWRKFNNSLYLRLLCRVSGRSEMNVGAKMQEMLDNPEKYPIIMSNDESAIVRLTGTDPYRSAYFATVTQSNFTTSSYHLTEHLLDATIVTENGTQSYFDPRLDIWALVGSTESWKGVQAGCLPESQGSYNTGAAYLNYPVFNRADMPIDLLDYSELQFIFAEASLKGLITGGADAARSYYEKAVAASMQKWSAWGVNSKIPHSITDDDIAAFLQSSLGSWDLNDNHEKLIGEQKVLSLFWVGLEGFHEIRRTGYPELPIGPGTYYNNYKYPQRFAYPNNTMATNNANVQEALTRMGGANDMLTPVWWSKKAITGTFFDDVK